MAVVSLTRNVFNPPMSPASLSPRPSARVSSISFTSASKFTEARNVAANRNSNSHIVYDVRCHAKGSLEEGLDKSKQITEETKANAKSGADTVAEKAKEGLETVVKTADGATEKAKEYAETIGDKAKEGASLVAEAAGNAKVEAESAGETVVDKVKDGASNATETVKGAWEDTGKAINEAINTGE